MSPCNRIKEQNNRFFIGTKCKISERKNCDIFSWNETKAQGEGTKNIFPEKNASLYVQNAYKHMNVPTYIVPARIVGLVIQKMLLFSVL